MSYNLYHINCSTILWQKNVRKRNIFWIFYENDKFMVFYGCWGFFCFDTDFLSPCIRFIERFVSQFDIYEWKSKLLEKHQKPIATKLHVNLLNNRKFCLYFLADDTFQILNRVIVCFNATFLENWLIKLTCNFVVH